MQKTRHILLIVFAVFLPAVLLGCDNKVKQERDAALAEAAAAKAELAKIKTELAEAKTALANAETAQSELAQVKADLTEAKAAAAAAADEKKALQEEIAKLTAELAKVKETSEKSALNSLNLLVKMQEQEKLIGLSASMKNKYRTCRPGSKS